MAEIRVEPKRRSPLPWIVGVLLLAVVAFVAYRWYAAGGASGPAGNDGTVVVDTAKP